MNQQRRTFRGRGGPTDRRLPKHNARRRKKPAPTPEQQTSQQQPDVSSSELRLATAAKAEAYRCRDFPTEGTDLQRRDSSEIADEEEGSANANRHPTISRSDEDGAPLSSGDDNEEEAQGIPELSSSSVRDDHGEAHAPAGDAPDGEDVSNDAEKDVQKEEERIERLMQRIQNNRETMRLSKSLTVPSNYRRLVLDAVKNTVREWGDIARQQPPSGADNSDWTGDDGCNSAADVENAATRVAMGLAVFELVQRALHCGPLAGSKPGYMKRCGSEVAAMVLDFLNAIMPRSPPAEGARPPPTAPVEAAPSANLDGDGEAVANADADAASGTETDSMPSPAAALLMGTYCWTEKQASALATWRANAEKALERGKPASKSLLKKQ